MPDGLYRLYLLGAVHLQAPDGRPVPIKAKKARAVLGFLGTGLNRCRARSWICSHVWSDRAAEQRAQSYRQVLLDLRRALGPDRDLLRSQASDLSFDPERLWVDLDDEDYLRAMLRRVPEPPLFMADLTLQDPAFEAWVAERRAWVSKRLRTLSAQEFAVGETASTVTDAPGPRPIVIRGNAPGEDERTRTFNAVLQDLICKSIDDTGAIRLMDEGTMPGLGPQDSAVAFRVQARAVAQRGGTGLTVHLTRAADGAIFANHFRLTEDSGTPQLDSFDLIDLVNEAVHGAVAEIADYNQRIPDDRIATALGFRALRSLTDYSPGTIARADRMLVRANEIDPDPSFLAWRAYLRTFLLGEGRGDHVATREEMESLIAHALEDDPTNSIILSLAAFIHSMWLLSNEDALDLAERSNRMNPANAFGIAYLGMVHTHLGNFEQGYRLTKRANALSLGPTSRASIAYVAMRSAACAGRFEEALRVGEALARRAPDFIAPQRLMGLLYLKTGRPDQAERMVQAMRVHENDYSFEKMRDAYRASPLLKNSVLAEPNG